MNFDEKKWLELAISDFAKTSIKDGEIWRATYTKEDFEGVKLLETWMKETNLDPYFDGVGNLIGRVKGESDKVIMVGSHRDTVKNGGRLDGALGVITGLIALASLYKELGEPKKTVEAIAFCEEEGSRFITGYIGSRNIIGQVSGELLEEKDSDGISLREAILDSGYSGIVEKEPRKDIERFVELHIEQGGILETKKIDIGVVEAVVGIYVGNISFYGSQNHAGTTPMSLRVDPVPVMSELIYKMNGWAMEQDDRLVCTFGNIEVSPNISNVIPGEATITFDIRSGEEVLLKEAEEKLLSLIEEAEEKVEMLYNCACYEPPTEMEKEGMALIEGIVKEKELTYQIMNSGAGHDAQIIGEHIKTNMIFVPSINGISHNPKEDTHIDNIYNGYLVLKELLKELAWR